MLEHYQDLRIYRFPHMYAQAERERGSSSFRCTFNFFRASEVIAVVVIFYYLIAIVLCAATQDKLYVHLAICLQKGASYQPTLPQISLSELVI